jgi:hypothetical protein
MQKDLEDLHLQPMKVVQACNFADRACVMRGAGDYLQTEDDVLRQLQQQISALQAYRQQQLERDTARAQAEVVLRRKAAETTQGLVKLNVGGIRYTTSLATLIAIPEAYFSSLFSGDWQQVLTAEGEVFLDRDGEVTRCSPGICVVSCDKTANCCSCRGSRSY